MSLRVVAGTRLRPAEVLPEPVKLDIPRIRQRRDLWCWVACLRMILRDSGLKQCAVAQAAFPERQCCEDELSCDEAIAPARIRDLWLTFGFALVPRCGPLTPGEIRTELEAGRPIQVWLGRMESCEEFTGDGHVVLIVGCRGAGESDMELTIRDPNPREEHKEVSYQALVEDLPYGPWVGTWTNIDPGVGVAP